MAVQIFPDPVTVNVNAGSLTVHNLTQMIVPQAVTINVNAGSLSVTNLLIVPQAVTVNVSAGSVTVTALTIIPQAVTVNVSAGSLTVMNLTSHIVPQAATVNVNPGSLTVTIEGVRLTRESVQVATQTVINIRLTRMSAQVVTVIELPNVRLTHQSVQVALGQSTLTDRTYIYSQVNQGWTEYDTRFLDAVTYLNERYLGLEGANGVFKTSPGAVLFPPAVGSVTARIQTGWIRIGGPASKARIRRIETILKMAADDVFTVSMYRDFIPDIYLTRSVSLGDNPHDGTPISTQERVFTLDGWGDRLETVKFEFEFPTLTEPFTLEGLTIFYTGGIDVRGEKRAGGVGE